MRTNCICARPLVRAGALVALFAALSSPAAAAASDVDLTGAWAGVFKAKSDRGTVVLNLAQDGLSGTLTGSAQNKDGDLIGLEGSYTVAGRRFAGTMFVEVPEGPMLAEIRGKCNGAETKIKMKVRMAAGGGAKVRLLREP